MPIRIHAIQTGSVRVREAQRRRKPGGAIRTLIDPEWTGWLPIYCWVVEHDEGLVLVDTGETARTAEPGYLPRWHPYYRLAVGFQVAPDEELGPSMRRLGLDPADIQTVVLTHLHTDHAGGLHHVQGARVLADAGEIALSRGRMGQLRGYLPTRWPAGFTPEPIAWTDAPVGPFERSARVTADGAIVVVPTPGHTPGHVSVVVRTDEASYFLSGDTSYDQRGVVEGVADGVGPDEAVSLDTLARIRALARTEPVVYLPAHDPEAGARLRERSLLGPALLGDS